MKEEVAFLPGKRGDLIFVVFSGDSPIKLLQLKEEKFEDNPVARTLHPNEHGIVSYSYDVDFCEIDQKDHKEPMRWYNSNKTYAMKIF